jgi:folylpolyglutamate synthase
VTAFISHILEASSCKVGRFNSPHLIDVWDCITINNKPVEKHLYDRTSTMVSRQDGQRQIGCSSFELLTATALQIFEELQVGVAVVEVGMGGRLDATNAIPDECIVASAITSVDLDHQKFLGDTVDLIAREKAGICRSGKPLVLGLQHCPGVSEAVEEVAAYRGSPLVQALKLEMEDRNETSSTQDIWSAYLPFINQRISSTLQLKGSFQFDNLCVALSLVDIIASRSNLTNADSTNSKQTAITADSICHGIEKCQWQGRLQMLEMTLPPSTEHQSCNRVLRLLLDGAHNSSAAKRLCEYLQTLPQRPTRYVIGLSHSPPKTPSSVLQPLLQNGDRVYVTGFSPVEGMPWVKPAPMEDLIAASGALVGRENVTMHENVAEALELASRQASSDELIVVAGSLYLIADALRFNRTLQSLSLGA